MQCRHTCLQPSSATGSLQLLCHNPWKHTRATYAMGGPLSHLAGLPYSAGTCLGLQISVDLPWQRIQGIWRQQSARNATVHAPARTSMSIFSP